MCPKHGDGFCREAPDVDEGSWTEPYWFCDQVILYDSQSPSLYNAPYIAPDPR